MQEVRSHLACGLKPNRSNCSLEIRLVSSCMLLIAMAMLEIGGPLSAISRLGSGTPIRVQQGADKFLCIEYAQILDRFAHANKPDRDSHSLGNRE